MRALRVPRTAARRIVYPLKDAVIRRDTLAVLAELRASERLPRRELAGLQTHRLRRILRHAYEHVPYYREVFSERGLVPEDIRTPADLRKLPVLTKEIIRARGDDLVAEGPWRRRAQRVTTSGSTGAAISVLCDSSSMSFRLANQLRGKEWHGAGIGDPEIRLWHNRGADGASSLAGRAFWNANLVKDRLLNIRVLQGADLTDESLARWEQLLRRTKPDAIYGYAASLYYLARFLRERNVPPDELRTKLVVLAAEKIVPSQKQLVTEAFASPVVDEYGCAEYGILAFECPQGRLHSSDESVVLEVPEPGPGGAGELHVTTLTNFATPLIRYRLGDVVSLSSEECPCGRSLGVIGEVAGRTTDFLVRRDGGRTHPFQINLVLQELEKIVRYRVVQQSVGVVELIVQLSSPLDPLETGQILAEFHDALGEQVEVRIRSVESVPRTPGGKASFLVSLVDQADPTARA